MRRGADGAMTGFAWPEMLVQVYDLFAKGKAELRATYSEISQDNLRDELECLVAALQAGLIGPDDFLPFRYSGWAAASASVRLLRERRNRRPPK